MHVVSCICPFAWKSTEESDREEMDRTRQSLPSIREALIGLGPETSTYIIIIDACIQQ